MPHIYVVPPIDTRWEHLKTVGTTAADMAYAEAQARAVGERVEQDPSYDDFMSAWEQAQGSARDKGWEGDFRNPPVVFWLPVGDSFQPGFVLKQDNNGTTFVASPVPLPHLKD